MIRSVEAMPRADYPATTMTRAIFLGLAMGAVVAATPALAQVQMYPGQGVTVNPAAIGGDGTNSPYARGQYVIHLHMPAPPAVHHHHVGAKPKPPKQDVANIAPDTTVAPAPTPPTSTSPYPPPLDSMSDTPTPATAKHAKHKHTTTAAAPATPPQPAPDNSGQDGGIPLTLDPQEPHPVQKPQKHKHASAAKPEKTASTNAPAASTAIVTPSDSTPGSKDALTRRSEVLFPRGDADVSSATVDKMRTVAADLTTLLGAGAQGVVLDAYGGPPGDKSSDSRRLSLKRALGIRQLLIEDGVPSERIDVRAMGGIDDTGAPDRVDVMVRGG